MIIKVEHLAKKIKGSPILSDICLTMESGHIYGLQGANGSGKTMLMRALCGLIYPSEGSVSVDGKILGKDIDFPPSVGLLLENPAFLPYYTGRANLMILAHLQKLPESTVDEALRSVSLDPLDSRKFKSYSLGMKQRLGIAGAILGWPDLVILDEPFNALDEDGIASTHQLILNLKMKGKLVVLACHDGDEFASLVDQKYLIKNGHITTVSEDRKLDEKNILQ